MSKGPDPKNLPLVINLETLPERCCAIGTTAPTNGDADKRGGYSTWFYDQRNRIMTPAVYHYPKMADLIINTIGFLSDTHDDEEIMGHLRGALYMLQLKKKAKQEEEKKRVRIRK